MRAEEKGFIALEHRERNKEYKSVGNWASSFSFLREEHILLNQAENYALSFWFCWTMPRVLNDRVEKCGL